MIEVGSVANSEIMTNIQTGREREDTKTLRAISPFSSQGVRDIESAISHTRIHKKYLT